MVNVRNKAEKVLPFSSRVFSWSPVNNKIILYGIYNDHKGNIEYGSRLIIYDPETEEIIKFPEDKSHAGIREIVNSPDGKKLAYIRNEKSGALTVWTMDPDGTNHKMVWNPRMFIRDLSWSK